MLQEVVIGEELRDVVDGITTRPRYVVVLTQRPEEVARRAAGRAKAGYGDSSVAQMDHVLHTSTPRLGLWLDNSDLTPETVDAMLGILDEAAIA